MLGQACRRAAGRVFEVAGARLYSASGPAVETPGGIFRASVANKTGLSNALDGVMRGGEHDMKVFGTGTLAALTTRTAFAKFTAAHYHFYAELERRLDVAADASTPSPSGRLWAAFATELRRTPALEQDLRDLLGTSPMALPPTPAVAAYVARIAEAAERENATGGTPPLLVAHFYTRYLADLFGGSMLGWPTRRALGFSSVPNFYQHDEAVVGSRRAAYIEAVYEGINRAGIEAAGLTREGGGESGGLEAAALDEMVEEAKMSFRLNAAIYAEEGRGSVVAAGLGGVRVMAGYAAERFWGPKEQRDLFGRLVRRKKDARVM